MMYELLEVRLTKEDSFQLIMETLTRIGVASKSDNILYQSCHILHKKGKYHITHFKEMFHLDGKTSDISENDIARRNTIANLLEQWGLLEIIDKSQIEGKTVSLSHIKILPFKEKKDWKLVPKYTVGNKSK